MARLQAAMASSMFDNAAARAKFERACKPPDPKALAAWGKRFGWTPPKELAEWEGVAPAYAKFSGSISDVWMIGRSIAVAKLPAIDKLINDHEVVLTLLTGLAHFGDDPSGDRCYVSTLPHSKQLAEVHVYDHETGNFDGATYSSIAAFVAACWGDVEDKTKRAKQAADPLALFARVKWLWSLPTGSPGYGFAQDLADAPSFETWKSEKKLLAKQPVLANYWMLAHYFLGNHTACAEAIALAKKAPGTSTPELAEIVANLLAQPTKAKLGKLSARALGELRDVVAKNADETLLEPSLRAAVAQQRAGAAVKADPKVIKRRLAGGEDGWALIAEFPDDVAAHELVLAALAKDKQLAKVVERYQEQRTANISMTWPVRRDPFDRRLSPVIGAAFRAGLAFDADHPRAASALVHALAHLDDDVAMDAFAAAIEKCRLDDSRLEYVVLALRTSVHPRASAILARAAWRFFEQKPPRTQSQLVTALVWRIRTGDAESEKLVDKVCSVTTDMEALGVAYGAAFAQIGNKRLVRHAKLVRGYATFVLAMTQKFSAETLFNAAEAALALATLEPAEATSLLRPVLDATEGDREVRLDKIGCALAGLLVLVPTDPDVQSWTERLLGNRTGAQRVFGVLRGVAAGKVAAAKSGLRWHAYHGCSSNHIGEKPIILRAARAALVALGEPEPPPFDETDEFAHKRKDAELPAALLQTDKHLTAWVFKRIVKRELRSSEVVRVGAEVLRDSYRFSADDQERASSDVRTEALTCMIFQGPTALPALATLLALPNMAGGDKTVVIYVMSMIASAPSLFARLAGGDDVLAALRPSPETIGTLDLAAGWALATLGDRAHAAIEAALRWRFAMVDDGPDHWIRDEPTASRLVRVAAALPNGKALLAELGVQAELQKPLRASLGDRSEVTLTSPKYACTIAVTKTKVAIEYRANDIYVNGILPDNRYTQTATIDAVSLAEAATVANRIYQTLASVGLTERVVKQPRR